MPFKIFPNIALSDPTVAFFELKQLLVASASWIAVSSSTSASFGPGDLITTSSAGPTGFDNTGSWYQVRSPNNQEFVVWRKDNDKTRINILYAPTTGAFLPATATAVRAPTGSATVNYVVSGSTSLWNRPQYATIWIGDAAEGFSFFVIWRGSGINSAQTFFGHERLIATSSLDQDPHVQHYCYSSTDNIGSFASPSLSFFKSDATQGFTKSWVRYGMTNSQYSAITATSLSIVDAGASRNAINEFIYRNPYDGRINSFPIYYANAPSSIGVNAFAAQIKGQSKHIRTNYNVNEGTIADDGSRIYFNYVSFPWISGTLLFS